MVEKLDLLNGLDLTNWEKTDDAGKGEVRVDAQWQSCFGNGCRVEWYTVEW